MTDHDEVGALLAQKCREMGVDVDSLDVKWSWQDGYTIDGMDWREWLEAMTDEG